MQHPPSSSEALHRLESLPPLPVHCLLTALHHVCEPAHSREEHTCSSSAYDRYVCRVSAPLAIGAPLKGGPLWLMQIDSRDGTMRASAGAAAAQTLLLERPRTFSLFREALFSLQLSKESHRAIAAENDASVAAWWSTVLAPYLAPSRLLRTQQETKALLVDGHGRFLLSLGAALHLLQTGSEGGSPFGFLQPVFHAQGRIISRDDILSGGESGRSCRRLLQVLRRLSRQGAARVPVGEGQAEEDWLDGVARRVQGSLTATGDCLVVRDDTNTTSCTQERVRALVRGVIHHVLATEVEGAALEALQALLVSFLCDATHSPLSTLSGAHVSSPLRVVLGRLRHLVSSPERVFQCAPPGLTRQGLGIGGTPSPFTAATRDGAVPACEGTVSQSQILPRQVAVLALEDGSVDAHKDALEERWWVRRHPSRVLLVRLDPAGDWLPAEEASYCTQTFFSFYENDLAEAAERQRQHQSARRRHHASRMRGAGGRAASDSEEDFEAMQHRTGGTRTVLPPPPSHSSLATSLCSASPFRGADEDEAIVARLMASANGVGTEAEVRRMRAGLRLCLYAVRHKVQTIVTPEKCPKVFHTVCQRCVPVLQALTQSFPGEHDAAHGQGQRARDAYCIRLVDCVRLQHFVALSRHGAGAWQPLVVCRDALRLAATADAPGMATRDGPVCEATCVLRSTTAHLLRHNLAAVLPAAPPPTRSEETEEETVWEALVPPSHKSLPSLGHRRACLVICLNLPVPSSSACVPESPIRDAAIESQSPQLLLAAPTLVLAERYTGLLLKCAHVLLGMFKEEEHEKAMTGPATPVVSLCAVRAGGAALVAASRAMREVAIALRSRTGNLHSAGPSRALTDHAMTAAVLDLLAEACLAAPNSLAADVCASHTAKQSFVGSSSGCALGRHGAGPRALRRLWGEALLAATSPLRGSAPPVPSPALHVHTLSLDDAAHRILSREARKQDACVSSAADGEVEAQEPRNVLERALRVFAPDASSPLLPLTGIADDDDLFVESLSDNTRLLRALPQALYHILIAAVGGLGRESGGTHS